ncbi:MAG: O-antigen ligase family protein [Deltaproteobacteria bacterium]|nr:O-antigen ligase family protein [Deltaproteobacteria bacterium]
MPASDQSRWWIAAEATLGAAVVVLAASLGGAPPWTLWLLCALAVVALQLWMVGASRNHRRWGWHPALLVPLAAAGLAVFQLVPLPPALLRLLSAENAELREFALVPLGLEQWRPITVDAPSTWRALARVIALGSLLVVAIELGRFEATRRRLLAVMALAGAATAVCGFGHELASAEALFGVHRFATAARFLTPFGNANHLAAWLTLTGTIALALAMDSRTRDAAVGWGAAALACGLGVFFSLSRGGIGTFVATWGLVGAVFISRRGGGLKAVFPWLVMGATVVFAGLMGFEQLLERADTVSSLEKLRATKVDCWPMFLKAAMAFPVAGMGLGAFELAAGRFQDRDPTVTFTHPENLGLQWLSEAGVPVALLLAALAVRAALRLWGQTASLRLERIALLGVGGVLLHDVFDYSLELNAVSTALVVVVGLVAGINGDRDARPRRAVRLRGLAVSGAVAAAVFGALVAGTPAHATAENELADVIRRPGTAREVRAAAVRGIDRHPADWVLYSNAAADAARRGDPREALAWVNRLLFLRPVDARAHVAAAQALVRLGKPRQALLEQRAAWRLGDASSLEWGLALAARERAWEAIVLDRRGHLSNAIQLLRARNRLEDAALLLRAAEAASPSEDVAAELAVLRIQHDADSGEVVAALAKLDALPREERESVPLTLLRVEVLGRLDRLDEGIKALEALSVREPGRLDVALRLADAYAGVRRCVAAREVLGRARMLAVEPSSRSLVFEKEAACWIAEERWPRALEALETAARVEPGRADLHYRVAEVLERMGSLHSALEELRRARLLDTPEGARSRDAWLQRLEAADQQGPR